MTSRTTRSTAATLVAIVVVIGTACWAIDGSHPTATTSSSMSSPASSPTSGSALPRGVVTVTVGTPAGTVG
ncbi:hypothetical protein BIU98_07855 [Curtobacterium sp. MMLR14_010]|uniref:hypothetical protein n=1 Tax=Curtobacterium sp. MMLR14_010 TaxID=1898743 RepID=UPI0008DE2020|nr:hypothetical protein [Curtobacterium sp. MMLR14_010]OII31665.1 hypothetical protein BIU98_07855 [Curtobacterium sp. MMLR14_010]